VRVLVTGGAGYVGSHVCAALKEAGHQVSIIDDLSEGHAEVPEILDIALIKGSILNPEDLDRAFRESRAEAVVHMAAKCLVGESVEQPDLYWRVNVIGSLMLAEAMKRAGAGMIVFSSSAATYGQADADIIVESTSTNPCNPYGTTKLVFEFALRELAAAGQLSYAAMRYFNAAGAHMSGKIGEDHPVETHLVPNMLKGAMAGGTTMKIFGTDYPTPDGTAVRDYVHVEDLARAHVLALEYLQAGGLSRSFNLGTGDGNSVRQVLEMAREVTGIEIPAEEGSRRAGDPPKLVASNQLALKELGWRPERDLKTILSSAWAWHSKHPQGY
jgi:UDP-glucose 4-epimerase